MRKIKLFPPIISIGPRPPVVLAKNVPIVNPIIAGHPKIMDNGNKASAIRIWN